MRELINTAVYVVGGMALICFALVICASIINHIKEGIEYRQYQKDREAREKAYRAIGQNLCNDHHWFGESFEAHTVLRVLGEAMYLNGSYDISKVRADWRRLVAGRDC